MYKLILKDFMIQKNNIKNYVITALFFSFIFTLSGMGQTTFAVATFLIIFNFSSRAFYEDENNHAMRWIATLPIKKSIVVTARYLSVIIAGIITILVFELIYDILAIQNGFVIETSTDNAVAFSVVLLTYITLISLYMPMIYKIGYIKAANTYRFMLFGFMAIVTFLSIKVSGEPPAIVGNIIQWMSEMSEMTLIIGLITTSVLIYMISLGVSIRIYSKKNYF